MKFESNVLVAPVISEKASRSQEKGNSVTFWVNPRATKLQIKQAVESFFSNVEVLSVRTSVKGRSNTTFGQISGRTKKKKKAFVKLAPGNEINFAEME